MGFGLEELDEGGIRGHEMIVPSKESGYYDVPFELTLTAPKGLDIFYTTDCSIPTRESIYYEAPIWIENASDQDNVLADLMGIDYGGADEYVVPDYKVDKATIIRAALFDGERKIGSDIVLTYFVGLSNKEVYASLPILSIVCGKEDLFHKDNGIYVNYEMRGKGAERFSNITYFSEDFQADFTQNVGIRIRGGFSRGVAQKGFNLYARNEYGKGTIKNIFDESGMPLESLAVVTEYDDIKIKDILPVKLSEGLEIGVMDCFPCNVFLNGEYWGLYFISERFDENYFYSHYGVEENNVVMIKSETVKLGEGSDLPLYNEMTAFVREHDMSDDDNYRLFSEMVDLDSLIDYYCLECYIYNQDWPYHNYALWRTRQKDESTPYGDGKWRFLLYDTNYAEAMNLHSGKDDPYLLLGEDKLIPYLMKNQSFRERFAVRMCDMANITAEIYKTEELLYDLGDQIKESVALSEKRFYGKKDYDIREKLQGDTLQFFYVRPDYIIEQTKSVFGLNRETADLVIVTDDYTQGTVAVNGLSIDLSANSWAGRYYSGLPVEIGAMAADGYCFGGWEVLSETGDVPDEAVGEVLMPESGIVIKVNFEDCNK